MNKTKSCYHKTCSAQEKEDAYYYFRNTLTKGSLNRIFLDILLFDYPTNGNLLEQKPFNKKIEYVIDNIQKSQKTVPL